jgi:chorismate mutase
MKDRYYLVREKAVPEVLLKVLEAKRLMKSGKMTVQQAASEVGISRSSFYKYQEDIALFHENAKGTTITIVLQMEDAPGILSEVLRIVAQNHGNILTIHQAIPMSGVATLTLSVELAAEEGDPEDMISDIEEIKGVHDLNILGRE